MKDLHELLSFMSFLSKNEQELLVKSMISVHYPKASMMRQCEQNCNGIMIVVNGQLRTYIMSEEGREVTLFRVFEDDICVLSAAGLMDAIAFDVIIDAVEETDVQILPISVLRPLMEKYPQIEAYLYRTATERFADVIWTMQQILFMSADKRVAQFLWDEYSRNKDEDITLTHDEIARYIGSAREVVTRILKYFQSEGIVVLSRGKIHIENKGKLRSIC